MTGGRPTTHQRLFHELIRLINVYGKTMRDNPELREGNEPNTAKAYADLKSYVLRMEKLTVMKEKNDR